MFPTWASGPLGKSGPTSTVLNSDIYAERGWAPVSMRLPVMGYVGKCGEVGQSKQPLFPKLGPPPSPSVSHQSCRPSTHVMFHPGHLQTEVVFRNEVLW